MGIKATEWHRLLDIDTEARTGLCSRCGAIDIKWDKRWRCGNVVRASRARTRERHPREEKRGQDFIDSKRKPHGLTVGEARALRAGKRCAICGTHVNLGVDHDHKRKYRRGVLCGHCNRGLGMFRDSPDLLRLAALYLEQPWVPYPLAVVLPPRVLPFPAMDVLAA
jgi:hypothetical protein